MKIELTMEEVLALKYAIEDVADVYEDTDECDCDDEEEYLHLQNVARMLKSIYAKIEEV